MERSKLDDWLFALENTRHTVTLPLSLSLDFASLTRGGSPHLPENGIVDFYKILYSRTIKFTSYIPEFLTLSTEDRKFLLSRNVEAVAIVRLSVCFDAKDPISQLKEFGRPDLPLGTWPMSSFSSFKWHFY